MIPGFIGTNGRVLCQLCLLSSALSENAHDPVCVCVCVCLCVFVCVSRYNELLFIIDTCQGASMYERFYSPNLMALASSQVGEDSLSVSYLPSYGRVKLKIINQFVSFFF